MHLILAIIRKEVKQIVRDPRTVGILFVVPAGLLLLVGYAITFDVKHVPLGIYDGDQSQMSRDLIASFVNSEYFDYRYALRGEDEITPMLDEGNVVMVINIPPRFAERLSHGESSPVQLLVDGSNASSATTALGYANAALMSYDAEVRGAAVMRMGAEVWMPVDFRPRVWYNPELKSVRFLVPGLIAFVSMITAVVATSMSIVREKERGTMEQIIVSPVTSVELIIGKLAPYLVIVLFSMALLIAAGFVVFGVGVAGNYFHLFVSVTLFLLCALGVGLFVSTISNTQQVAFQISTLVSSLPTMILSGFIFPIRSMPFAIQIATYVSPAKYFVRSIRAIMLKGVGVDVLWSDWGSMMVFAVVILGISSLRLRRQQG